MVTETTYISLVTLGMCISVIGQVMGAFHCNWSKFSAGHGLAIAQMKQMNLNPKAIIDWVAKDLAHAAEEGNVLQKPQDQRMLLRVQGVEPLKRTCYDCCLPDIVHIAL